MGLVLLFTVEYQTVHLSVSDSQQVIMLLFRPLKCSCTSRFDVQSVLCTYVFIFSCKLFVALTFEGL